MLSAYDSRCSVYCRDLNACRYHVEVYLRYPISYSNTKPRTILLAYKCFLRPHHVRIEGLAIGVEGFKYKS